MGKELNFIYQKRDPKAELQAAVNTLNEFNQQKQPSFQTLFSGFISLVAEGFSENKKKQADSLKQAIQTLKRNYALIPKLETGDPHERNLALFVRSVIEKFNAHLEETENNKYPSVKDRITSFLSSHFFLNKIEKIELPKGSSIRFDETGIKKVSLYDKAPKLPHTIFASTFPLQQPVAQLSGQAVQLFHMKVISLIEKYKLLSHREARFLMQHACLRTVVNSQNTACLTTCDLYPFPGHTITVTGLFDKDPKLSLYTIPSKERPFQLTMTSTQKGFPHPSQLDWALPDLVPEYLQDFHCLPLFKMLYQEKEAISQALHPNGKFLEKAKRQLECRRKVFNENKVAKIQLHKSLHLALLRASPSQESAEAVHDFFTRLQQLHLPYDYLTQTYHLINDLYFKRCQEVLQNIWFDGKLTDERMARDILLQESIKIQEELQQQKALVESDFEKCTFEFVLFMGKIFLPWHEIILQQFSEIVPFPSSDLSLYTQKLQMLAISQFMTFAEELNDDRETVVLQDGHLLTAIDLINITSPNELPRWGIPYKVMEEFRRYYKKKVVL